MVSSKSGSVLTAIFCVVVGRIHGNSMKSPDWPDTHHSNTDENSHGIWKSTYRSYRKAGSILAHQHFQVSCSTFYHGILPPKGSRVRSPPSKNILESMYFLYCRWDTDIPFRMFSEFLEFLASQSGCRTQISTCEFFQCWLRWLGL